MKQTSEFLDSIGFKSLHCRAIATGIDYTNCSAGSKEIVDKSQLSVLPRETLSRVDGVAADVVVEWSGL